MADVIAVCGAYRTSSLNRKLLRLAVREVQSHGLTVEVVDLKQLALPVYDGDIEASEGLPEKVKELKAKLSATPGLLIVSPEYNSSIPGGLKNFIDWLSRPPGNPFAGRVVSVNNASDGAFGGARANLAIKSCLQHLGAWVAPASMTLPRADTAFDDQGELKEGWMKKQLSNAINVFSEGVRALRKAS